MHIVASQHPRTSGKKPYILVLTAASAVFLLLLTYALLSGADATIDKQISEWLQNLRHPALDRMMVLVTMLGDQAMIVALLAIVVICLLIQRRWWLSIHLACVYLSTTATVTLIKVLTDRTRPEYAMVDLASFSFPSGHTSSAALLAGIFALLINQGKSVIFKRITFLAAGSIAVLVAVSRVYLSAHWASDVLAGLALAFMLLTAVAWQLRLHGPVEWRYRNTLLCSSIVILSVAYWYYAYASQAPRYGLSSSFML